MQDGVLAADNGTLGSLHEEVVLLARLVDDLQELSLAEAGRLRINKQAIGVRDLVEPAVHALPS